MEIIIPKPDKMESSQNKEHGLNIWDEIVDYFIEKRACDENYTKRECSCFENKNVLEMKRK